MSEWARAFWGDPCRECGFDWNLQPAAAIAVVASVPARGAELLSGADGRERIPELSWPAVAYVEHVADNLRIWAERLAAAALGGSAVVVPYDQDALAAARAYEHLPIEGALWSLARATETWQDAVALALDADVTLVHPERGLQHVTDVVRTNTHDALHHLWDLERIRFGQKPSPGDGF